MKYVSMDTETTGLNTEKDIILQIGAVIDDTKWWVPGPDFVAVEDLPSIKMNLLHDRITGQITALAMNGWILSQMREYNDAKSKEQKEEVVAKYGYFIEQHLAAEHMGKFLKSHLPINNYDKPIHINVAGKNFGTYDWPMLKRLPKWENNIIMRQRIMDPSILWWDPQLDGESLPNLATCMERAGIEPHVTHDALEDSRDVVRCVRNFYLTDPERVYTKADIISAMEFIAIEYSHANDDDAEPLEEFQRNDIATHHFNDWSKYGSPLNVPKED